MYSPVIIQLFCEFSGQIRWKSSYSIQFDEIFRQIRWESSCSIQFEWQIFPSNQMQINEVAGFNLTNLPLNQRKIKLLYNFQLICEFSVKSDANQVTVLNFTNFSVKLNANEFAGYDWIWRIFPSNQMEIKVTVFNFTNFSVKSNANKVTRSLCGNYGNLLSHVFLAKISWK